MYARIVVRGFIDSRRPDTLTVIIDFKPELKGIQTVPLSDYEVSLMIDRFALQHPDFFSKFAGREYWVEINGVRYCYVSGKGTTQTYPMPEGELVNLTIYME